MQQSSTITKNTLCEFKSTTPLIAVTSPTSHCHGYQKQNIHFCLMVAVYSGLLHVAFGNYGLCLVLPGDDVTVYGVMCQRWKPLYDGNRCDVELVLKANNIEVNNQHAGSALLMEEVEKEFEDFWDSYKHNPMAGGFRICLITLKFYFYSTCFLLILSPLSVGRNQILLSLCPQVFGMYVIKLAVAMVLAGGVQRIDPSGTKIRGNSLRQLNMMPIFVFCINHNDFMVLNRV